MRSTWILIAILVVLIPVAGTVYYLRYKTAAEREARWQTMGERGDSFTAVNDPGTPHLMFAAQADVEAIPVPVQVAGPVAETKKIELAWTDADGTQGVLRYIDGCAPAGEGRDVIWQGADLYLATATDKLRRIWTTDDPDSSFGPHPSFICFDGRYVWAPLTRPGGAPRLILVDPQGEKAWEYRYVGNDGALPGVPPYSASATREYRLGVASLSPGKVCAAIRLWEPPAIPASGPAPRGVATKLWFGTFEFESPDQRTAVPFPVTAGLELLDGPFEMLTLVADARRAVLVGRGDNYPPVMVDPDAREVKAVASNMGNELLTLSQGQQFVVHDGAVWYLKRIRPATHELSTITTNDLIGLMSGRPALAKATLPDLKEELVLRDVPVGLLVESQGSLHIVGERCWRLRGSGPQLETLAVQPPWQFDGDPNRNAPPNQNAGAATSADGSTSAVPARDPHAARHVFASGIYGLLVSASVDQTPNQTDRVVYQLSIPPTASTSED